MNIEDDFVENYDDWDADTAECSNCGLWFRETNANYAQFCSEACEDDYGYTRDEDIDEEDAEGGLD